MQNEAGQTGNHSSSTVGNGESRHLSDVAEDIKQRAAAAKGEVRQQAEVRADHWRDGAMDAVANVAEALNAAASSLRGNQAWLAEPVTHIADRVDNFIEAGRDKSLTEIKDEIEDLTRRNPVLVVGGAIAFGFALSRVLKSSPPSDGRYRTDHRPSRATEGGSDDL